MTYTGEVMMQVTNIKVVLISLCIHLLQIDSVIIIYKMMNSVMKL
jgi:hypothetical protein